MQNVSSNIQQPDAPVSQNSLTSSVSQSISSSPETTQLDPPRKKNEKQRKRWRIPLFLAVTVALILLAAIFILTTNPGELIAPKPENIMVSNISSRSFTVTWTTVSKTSGSVLLLTSDNQLPGYFGKFSGETFYDDRDMSAAQLEDASFTGSPKQRTRFTHAVTIYNIDPENSYSFTIGGEWFIWDPKEIDITEQVITNKESEELQTPDPAYGQILYQDDRSPVFEAIVYAWVYGPYSIDLGLLSATTNGEGGYYFDMANVTIDMENEDVPISTIEITIQTGDHTSDPMIFGKDTSAPFETILISNETGSTIESESSGKIVSKIYATDNCCDDPGWGACSSNEDWERGWRACSNGRCPACSDGPSDSEEDESCDSNLHGQKANCAGDLYCYDGKCRPKRDGSDEDLTPQPEPPPGKEPGGYKCKPGWDPDCCGNTGGECLNTNNFKCSSGFVSNRCPGASNIRCCYGTYSEKGSTQQEESPTEPEPTPDMQTEPTSQGTSSCHNKNQNNAEANGCANADGSPNWSDCSRKGMVDACADPNQDGVPDLVADSEGVGVQAGGDCRESWCSSVTSEHGCRDKPHEEYQGDPRYDARCSGDKTFHRGIDVVCPPGDRGCDITAVDDGTVIHSGDDPWCGGLGCCVAVRNNKGKIITAGHLDCDGDMPDKGEVVDKGDKIGEEGTSGNSTGLHTDVSVYDPERNDYVDPTAYLYGGDEDEDGVQTRNSEFPSLWSGLAFNVLAQEENENPSAAYITDKGYIIVTSAGIFIPIVDGYNTTTESLYIDESEVGEPIAVFYDINENGRRDPGEPKISQGGIRVNLSEDVHAIAYSIKPGFNIVSFPFYSEDFDAASEILQEVQNDGGYATMISRFNNDLINRDGNWHGYEIRNDQPYGEDFGIMPGVGYVLRSWKESTLIIRAQTFADAVPVYYHPGWNLIAIHGSNTVYTAEEIIDTTNDSAGSYSVDTVSSWLTSAGKWESIVKDEEGGLYGFDFPIDSRYGYFIRSVDEDSFDVTYK